MTTRWTAEQWSALREVTGPPDEHRSVSPRWRLTWGDHGLGADPAVEVVAGDVAEGDGGVAQGEVVGVGVLGDLGGAVVADVGGEGGDEHEGAVELAVDLGAVGGDAAGAVGVEGAAGIAEEAEGLEDGVGDEGFVDVELEVAGGGAEGDGEVVGEDAGADHGHGLALGGGDLAGHDGAAGLVFGDGELDEA